MCAITGIYHDKNALSKVVSALKLMQNRGQDATGIFDGNTIQTTKNSFKFKKTNSEHVFGHNLHAIVGHISQPISFSTKKRTKKITKKITEKPTKKPKTTKKTNTNEGTLIANCEIYNWQELKQKLTSKHSSKITITDITNDAKLLLAFLDSLKFNEIHKHLSKLDGVFAFAYQRGENLFLARDILGVKPLFYAKTNEKFSFASEKKALEQMGFIDIKELNPRHVLYYNISENKLSEKSLPFFSIKGPLKKKTSKKTPSKKAPKTLLLTKIKSKTKSLLEESIIKRIPKNQKVGLLFSGGIDSTYIAMILKKHNIDFTCYTAAIIDEQRDKLPSDLLAAKSAAKILNLKLKIAKINPSKIPKYLKKIVPLIEDNNVVKVSVALTFFLACEKAKKDNCKVVFSGLGSEEIFAGYERHKNSTNINKECLSGLIKIYERDLYRDDTITMHNNLELRLPFLDHKLIKFALTIPAKYKLKDGLSKWILRQISLAENMPPQFALRKKKAAQYGSRTNDAIKKLAKQSGQVYSSKYLSTFYPRQNLKLAVLFSGGKDSCSAAYIMQQQNYQLSCLITLLTENEFSYMFQKTQKKFCTLQARAMDLPIITKITKGEKETELSDLRAAIKLAKEKYRIDGIITGALFSNYQRDRIETISDELGLKIFSPLWHKNQETHMQELIKNGFHAIISKIAADGLTKDILGKRIGQNLISRLKKMPGLNIAGEGGEFETLVLDGPKELFKHKLKITKSKKVMDSKYSGDLIIESAKLLEKKS